MISEILKECELKGISLKAQQNGLIKCSPGQLVDPALLEKIKANKPLLLVALNIMEIFKGHLKEERPGVYH